MGAWNGMWVSEWLGRGSPTLPRPPTAVAGCLRPPASVFHGQPTTEVLSPPLRPRPPRLVPSAASAVPAHCRCLCCSRPLPLSPFCRRCVSRQQCQHSPATAVQRVQRHSLLRRQQAAASVGRHSLIRRLQAAAGRGLAEYSRHAEGDLKRVASWDINNGKVWLMAFHVLLYVLAQHVHKACGYWYLTSRGAPKGAGPRLPGIFLAYPVYGLVPNSSWIFLSSAQTLPYLTWLDQ